MDGPSEGIQCPLPHSRAGSEFRAEAVHQGFIAAHCGAPAIVDKADGEARHFLPDDYPYFVDGASERDVRAMLSRVTTEFSSVSWRYAQSAMAKIKQRQSRDAIASQFASAAEAELLLLGGRPPLSPAPPDLIL